jgi:hypothetical protein
MKQNMKYADYSAIGYEGTLDVVDHINKNEFKGVVENYVFKGYTSVEFKVLLVRKFLSGVLKEVPGLDKLGKRLFSSSIPEDFYVTLEEIAKNGKVFVVRENGEIVGMISVMKVDHMNDGRVVYEITKASVLKRSRGKGYYSKLAKCAEDYVSLNFPESPIIRTTSNPLVKHLCQKKGYRRVHVGDKSEIAALIERNQALRGLFYVEGHEIYYFDPLEDGYSS